MIWFGFYIYIDSIFGIKSFYYENSIIPKVNTDQRWYQANRCPLWQPRQMMPNALLGNGISFCQPKHALGLCLCETSKRRIRGFRNGFPVIEGGPGAKLAVNKASVTQQISNLYHPWISSSSIQHIKHQPYSESPKKTNQLLSSQAARLALEIDSFSAIGQRPKLMKWVAPHLRGAIPWVVHFNCHCHHCCLSLCQQLPWMLLSNCLQGDQQQWNYQEVVQINWKCLYDL